MEGLETYTAWPKEFTFDEESDFEVTKCWVIGGHWAVPARKPLGHWTLMHENILGWRGSAEQSSCPTSKGVVTKSIQGLFYTGLRPTTQEEEKQREPKYREWAKPWFDDFEAVWRGKIVPELMQYIKRLKEANLEKLNNVELLKELEYWRGPQRRVREIKFTGFYATFVAFKEFRELCEELIGIDEDDLRFKRLMLSHPTIAYAADKGVSRLAVQASELGLEPLFNAVPDNDELLVALEQSEAGSKWLRELRELLNEHGWRLDRMGDTSTPSWIEKPALAIRAIRGNVGKGGAGALDQELRGKEKEEAEREVLSLVPEDKRDWFRKLMKAAQWSSTYNEEHEYYHDYIGALGRRIFSEIAKRATEAGALDDTDEINFLIYDEIMTLLVNMDSSYYRRLARIRREEYQRFDAGVPKMLAEKLFIGDVNWLFENLGREPILWVLGGPPKVKPELEADLYGAASAPGVAEGTARVLFDEAQLPELQAGDILVVPDTNPVWNPAFNFIKAVVTDTGGSLSHAIVVARDYGLPCVAGTREATAKIKTGDRIRVDGDNCAVYILERAA